MQTPPTPDEVRALIAPLVELDRKVLGGLAAVMIAQSDKVRDQEWLSEQFVHLAVVAHGIEDEDGGEAGASAAPASAESASTESASTESASTESASTESASTEDVEKIRAYAQARMPDIMLAAAKLFVRIAEDLRGRASYTFDDAQGLVRDYLALDAGTLGGGDLDDSVGRPDERDDVSP